MFPLIGGVSAGALSRTIEQNTKKEQKCRGGHVRIRARAGDIKIYSPQAILLLSDLLATSLRGIPLTLLMLAQVRA